MARIHKLSDERINLEGVFLLNGIPIEAGGTGGLRVVRDVTDADSPVTLDPEDDVINADAASGDISIIFPAGTPAKQYTIRRKDGSAFTVTASTTGGETIDGALTVALILQFERFTALFDGASEWMRVD